MSHFISTESASSLFPGDTQVEIIATGKDFEYYTCSNEFSLKRAQPSRLYYLDPRPAEPELRTIYPPHYEPYRFDELPLLIRKARGWVQRGKLSAIKRFAPPNARIIDIGCGNGALLRLMKSYGPSSWELHANDLNHDSLNRLAEEGIIPQSGKVERLQIENYFDVVILNQVIEHFADVRGLLNACFKLLKPGGILLIETPSTEGLDARIFQKRHWGGYHFPRHFYLFDEANLAQLCHEHDFVVKSSRYLASPAFWIQSLHHYFLDAGFVRLSKLFTIRNLPLVATVTSFDLLRSWLGGKTSNMRLVAQKVKK